MSEYRSQHENDELTQALLCEVRSVSPVFYALVFAQAQRIQVLGDEVVLSFGPGQSVLSEPLLGKKAWVERMLYQVTGRNMMLVVEQ